VLDKQEISTSTTATAAPSNAVAHMNDTHMGAADNRGVQDEADGLASGISAGQGEYTGAVAVGPDRLGTGAALPGPLMELGEHHVGAVDLIAGGGEVLADRAELGAPVDAVSQQAGGLRLVGVGAGAGMFAQLVLEFWVDRPGFDEPDQAAGEIRLLGPGG